tara:strand:+ start:320 stop:553 length:234 start_codon:yes stop_codon:yes gene_type:complete
MSGVTINILKKFSTEFLIDILAWLNKEQEFKIISKSKTDIGGAPIINTTEHLMNIDITISTGWNLNPELKSKSKSEW